jgi:hypothetical protein
MLTTATLEKSLRLVDEGSTFASITEQTGITAEDAEAVHIAWFKGTTEQLFRDLQLAGVLELAAAKLRSGMGWDKGTTSDILGEILHVYARRPIPLTTGDIPVRTDVFLHNLEPFTLEALRRAVGQGLTPSGLDFGGDDDSIVILRFTRLRVGEVLKGASIHATLAKATTEVQSQEERSKA